MDLNKIVPLNDNRWSVSDNIIYFKKLMKIPVLIVIDDIPHIILEGKLVRQVIQLTEILMGSGLEFYFTIPDSTNPSGVFDFESEVINSYFHSYSNRKFYLGFNKIGFDLIENLIKWCDKRGCWDLVKPIYDKVNKEIQRKHFDWWSKQEKYDYQKDIREEFNSLWRDIQINKIL